MTESKQSKEEHSQIVVEKSFLRISKFKELSMAEAPKMPKVMVGFIKKLI